MLLDNFHFHIFYTTVVWRIDNNTCHSSFICPISVIINKFILCIIANSRNYALKTPSYSTYIMSMIFGKPLLLSHIFTASIHHFWKWRKTIDTLFQYELFSTKIIMPRGYLNYSSSSSVPNPESRQSDLLVSSSVPFSRIIDLSGVIVSYIVSLVLGYTHGYSAFRISTYPSSPAVDKNIISKNGSQKNPKQQIRQLFQT